MWAWQLPSRKLPQAPSGVPKLANFIDEIFWPGPHHKWALGLSGLLTLPEACICQLMRFGCHSKISAHTLSISLLTKNIPFGSPANSSKTTSKFPVGFSHERGTWYLKILAVVSFPIIPYLHKKALKQYIFSLTIFGKPPHNYLSISSHHTFQHNYIHHKYQLLYKQASSGQDSVHLSTLDLCPCCPYPRPMGCIRLEHWT